MKHKQTIKKINTDNNKYLKYVSEYVILESGISGNAIKLWLILQLQYRKHFAGTNDVVKAYRCHNAYLADKMNCRLRALGNYIKELRDAHLLFSEPTNGGASYRVPLDPADSNYDKTVECIKAFLIDKRIRTDNWIKRNKKTVDPVKITKSVETTEENQTNTTDQNIDIIKENPYEKLTLKERVLYQLEDGGNIKRYKMAFEEDGNLHYEYSMNPDLLSRLNKFGKENNFQIIRN